MEQCQQACIQVKAGPCDDHLTRLTLLSLLSYVQTCRTGLGAVLSQVVDGVDCLVLRISCKISVRDKYGTIKIHL